MIKIHRYTKQTIAKQVWEIAITEFGDKIEIVKIHLKSNRVDVIKETTEEISQKQFEKFKEKNAEFHIETYEKIPTN